MTTYNQNVNNGIANLRLQVNYQQNNEYSSSNADGLLTITPKPPAIQFTEVSEGLEDGDDFTVEFELLSNHTGELVFSCEGNTETEEISDSDDTFTYDELIPSGAGIYTVTATYTDDDTDEVIENSFTVKRYGLANLKFNGENFVADIIDEVEWTSGTRIALIVNGNTYHYNYQGNGILFNDELNNDISIFSGSFNISIINPASTQTFLITTQQLFNARTDYINDNGGQKYLLNKISQKVNSLTTNKFVKITYTQNSTTNYYREYVDAHGITDFITITFANSYNLLSPIKANNNYLDTEQQIYVNDYVTNYVNNTRTDFIIHEKRSVDVIKDMVREQYVKFNEIGKHISLNEVYYCDQWLDYDYVTDTLDGVIWYVDDWEYIETLEDYLDSDNAVYLGHGVWNIDYEPDTVEDLLNDGNTFYCDGNTRTNSLGETVESWDFIPYEDALDIYESMHQDWENNFDPLDPTPEPKPPVQPSEYRIPERVELKKYANGRLAYPVKYSDYIGDTVPITDFPINLTLNNFNYPNLYFTNFTEIVDETNVPVKDLYLCEVATLTNQRWNVILGLCERETYRSYKKQEVIISELQTEITSKDMVLNVTNIETDDVYSNKIVSLTGDSGDFDGEYFCYAETNSEKIYNPVFYHFTITDNKVSEVKLEKHGGEAIEYIESPFLYTYINIDGQNVTEGDLLALNVYVKGEYSEGTIDVEWAGPDTYTDNQTVSYGLNELEFDIFSEYGTGILTITYTDSDTDEEYVTTYNVTVMEEAETTVPLTSCNENSPNTFIIGEDTITINSVDRYQGNLEINFADEGTDTSLTVGSLIRDGYITLSANVTYTIENTQNTTTRTLHNIPIVSEDCDMNIGSWAIIDTIEELEESVIDNLSWNCLCLKYVDTNGNIQYVRITPESSDE